MTDTLHTALDDRSVVVCLGPGGVGKTTTAAAIGVAAARRGRRAVVLTIDPARRLADALGLDGISDGVREIDLDATGSLHIAMLDPGATFDDVIAEHATSPAQTERILANRIYRNLTAGLSGVSEYMASERLRALHLDDRFDLVVIDTPPSRHAFDFLDGPGRLARFVDHPIYRSVLAPRRGVLRAVNATARLVVRTIARVVGADLVDDAVGFFAAFEGMDTGFRDRAAEVEALLADTTRTSFLLVGSARLDAARELRWIGDNLAGRDLAADLLVVNRVSPLAVGTGDMTAATDPSGDADGPLAPVVAELVRFAEAERHAIGVIAETTGVDVTRVVAEQATPVADLDGVVSVAEALLG